MKFHRYKRLFLTLLVVAVAGLFTLAYFTYIDIRKSEKGNRNFLQKTFLLEQLQNVRHNFYEYYAATRQPFTEISTESYDQLKLKEQGFVWMFDALYTPQQRNALIDTASYRELSALVESFQNMVTSLSNETGPGVQLHKEKIESLHYKIDAAFINTERKLLSEINSIGYANLSFSEVSSKEFILLFTLFCLLFCIPVILTIRELKSNTKISQKLLFNNSILSSITNPVITVDRNMLITTWNKSAEIFFEYSAEEAAGKQIIDFLQASFIETKFENASGFYSTHEWWEGTMKGVSKTGQIRYVSVTYSRIRDEKNEPAGATVVMADISKSQKVTEQLQALTSDLTVEVKDRERALNHVFERITDAFFALDKNWNYVYVNPRAAYLHGKSVEELIGKNIWDLHPDQEGSPFYKALHESLHTMQPLKKQFYYKTGNQWFEDFIYPSEEGLSVYYNDITERIESETRLKETETKYRSLVEGSIVGVYIIQDYYLSYVNPTGAAILGYTPEEMIDKKKVFDIIPEFQHSMVSNNILKRVSGKEKSLRYEVKLIHKDGHFIDVEVFGTFIMYNNAPAIIGTMIDITERKRNEKANQILKERLELVVKATNDGIWDWDIVEDVIIGNDTFYQMLGVASGTPIRYEDFEGRLHQDDAKRVRDNLKESFQLHKDYINEIYKFMISENKYKVIHDRSYVLYDENGKPYRMLGAMQDITEQTEISNRVIAEKMLSDGLISSLPGVFYIFNTEGRFLRWNQNFLNFSGYTDLEIKSIHLNDFFLKDELDLLKNEVAKILETGEGKITVNVKTKHTIKPYYLTGMRIVYEGAVCIMGVGLDMSEKIEAEQKLRDSEELFRMLIEQASDAILITDESGNFQIVNTNLSLLTGYTDEALYSKKLQDILLFEDGTAVDCSGIQSGSNTTLTEGMLVTADNQRVSVEWSVKELPDKRFQYIIRDIRKRKSAEKDLRNSEHKYRLLFEQNPMPMWMLSLPERKFLAVNDAAVAFYGYDKATFLEMRLEDIQPEKLRDVSNIANTYQTGIQNHGVYEHIKKNGDKVMVGILSHEIEYEGRPAKLELANDMTEKIQAEEALKKSHEELRMLASYLEKARETERTHIAREIHDELGQQLTGLKMDLSWLNKKINVQDESVKEKMKEVMGLMDETVKSVRTLATKLRPSLLDDLGLVAAMEWQSEEFQKRTGIQTTLETQVATRKIPQEIATNLFRIYQESLTNILRHAQATNVQVKLTQHDAILELQIHDNGKGFDEKMLAMKQTLGILGMKERTIEMNGIFSVISKPGQGTTIQINVPLVSL